jgi:uncharacterized protein YjiS (DUF1127 family)
MRLNWMGADLELGAPLALRPMINSQERGRRARTMRSWFAGALERVREWRRRTEQRAELARLSTFELHDIGLSEAEVWAETQKWFWQQ